MKIFTSEFVCGGGWPEADLPKSLAMEGGAMLLALCEDCARLPDVEVVTTLDARCPLALPTAVEVINVSQPDEEWKRFLELSISADFTIVIAPELDDTLTTRIRAARNVGANVLAPSDNVIALCSDKLRLAEFLIEHDVPTIPTFSAGETGYTLSEAKRFVVKPRFGAGSLSIRVVPPAEVIQLRTSPGAPPADQLIVQPYIDGDSFSVGLIADGDGGVSLLPVARQRLSEEGKLHYLGGTIPWKGTAAGAMQKIVRRCHQLLDGMKGYVGFDFVIPVDAPAQPLLVEINPRLSTSYLGYRRLTDENLAARMFPGSPRFDVDWKGGTVEFAADGTWTRIAKTGAVPCA